ncbi:ATP-dependent endonuclease [uncultured Megasphaera sp.]|uniref:ATP-dependent nuclease n=1 Tax=uncultured Megasphaera sp. TaxID=165188 RepID=UPI0025E813BD|nr:AAA family ATPase [uncultured Megasphaera sp.]
MYITYLRIQNYRNLRDVEMTFHEKANYIVGENAIGKSGLLRLISYVSDGRNVEEDDYADVTKPIVITLALHLMRSEKEHFAADPEEHRQEVRLRMEMRVSDISPKLYDDVTGEELPLELIRRLRYVSYSSAVPDGPRVPPRIYRSLERRLADWSQAHWDDFSDEARAFIQHEVAVGNLDSSYYVDIFLLSRILCRMDRPRADNMKFISLAALCVLTQIFIMSLSKAVPLDENIVIGEDGKRYLPLIISIDEPEMHLHPYMQRSVLHYYQQLLANEDPQFCALIKDLFDIDGLRGQLFIVTHSTDSLIDDYRNIIRLYRDKAGRVRAACGAGFHFNEEIEKHLIMHFPEVKEALYSRSVLIVEGETEYGCFQHFAKTLDLPFDYYGICLINARGESSISKIKKLLEYFKIPVVALYDADVRTAHKNERGVYFTNEICFEMDLAKTMIDHGQRRELDRIINTACGEHARATTDMIKKACRKLDVNYHDYPARLLWHVNPRNRKALYIYYFAWLYSNKGVILGRLIGQSLKKKDIPPAFIQAIEAAGQLAKVSKAV